MLMLVAIRPRCSRCRPSYARTTNRAAWSLTPQQEADAQFKAPNHIPDGHRGRHRVRRPDLPGHTGFCVVNRASRRATLRQINASLWRSPSSSKSSRLHPPRRPRHNQASGRSNKGTPVDGSAGALGMQDFAERTILQRRRADFVVQQRMGGQNFFFQRDFRSRGWPDRPRPTGGGPWPYGQEPSGWAAWCSRYIALPAWAELRRMLTAPASRR